MPKQIRLYKNREYTRLKIKPGIEKKTIKELTNKPPIMIKNSPTKLKVPGNPKFAKVKKKYKTQKIGKKQAKPP